jgi:penicillin-binding protein 1A
MTEVYRRKPAPPDWPRPDGLIAREIDRTTGMLRNAYCPAAVVMTEWYIPGTEPAQECDVHSATDTMVGDSMHFERPGPPNGPAGTPTVASPQPMGGSPPGAAGVTQIAPAPQPVSRAAVPAAAAAPAHPVVAGTGSPLTGNVPIPTKKPATGVRVSPPGGAPAVSPSPPARARP